MAKNGKMIILRGNDDPDGKSYPDENGKMVKWPIGALHVQATKDYAKRRDYEPIVLDLSGKPQSEHSPQSKAALKLVHDDPEVHALYGFSGGGYNVLHILTNLQNNEPALLGQINLVVVIGSPNKRGNAMLYEPSRFGQTAAWELVFRCNPPPGLMPKGLPKGTPGHMFGPDVLLTGWPEASSNC